MSSPSPAFAPPPPCAVGAAFAVHSAIHNANTHSPRVRPRRHALLVGWAGHYQYIAPRNERGHDVHGSMKIEALLAQPVQLIEPVDRLREELDQGAFDVVVVAGILAGIALASIGRC